MDFPKGEKYFVRKVLLTLLWLGATAWAYPPLPEARTESEALFVRRIIDFWREKEYPFVKSQVQSYLHSHPDSPFVNHFWALLGDIALHEKNNEEALFCYNQVTKKGFVEMKKWQTLYHLARYEDLYEELSTLPLSGEEEKFYFAESAFRLALLSDEERARVLCSEALPYYEELRTSRSVGAHATLALAEINRLLKRPEIAVQLYLEVAKNNEENQADILFHAAALLVEVDSERASQLFAALALGSSDHASEAAYQWLLLLANRGEWEKLADQRSVWLEKLSNKQLKEAYFYLGMIALDKKNYEQAARDLQEAPPEKSALEGLLVCSRELDRIDLCEKSFALLKELYPQHLPEASFLRAAAYKGKEALHLFNELIANFPSHAVAENGRIQRVRLLMEMKQWKEARQAALTYLKEYPHSKRIGEMHRLAISLSQMQGDSASLAEDLERAFAARIFQSQEKQEKEELLIQTYLKLGSVNAALGILHEMKDPDPLLFALCYIKEGNSPEKLVAFGEKALERHPEQERLHLHLFNAYLALSQVSENEFFTKKAAEHLHQIIDRFSVSIENRLWLAHYFAKKEDERALSLLQSLLETEANIKRFAKEGVALARLYQKKREWERALALLERLPDIPEKRLIEAECLSSLGNRERAIALFAGLEEAPLVSIAYTATLHLARLCFDQSPQQSLDRFRLLKMSRSLATEPIHLEAALDYADLQASLQPKEKQVKDCLNTLLEMKETYTTESDIASKDYHECRKLMPEKDLIYQAYMRYLDARIYLLQAKLTRDPHEARVKESAARALLSTLRQGKYAVSAYLIERAKCE